MYCRGSGTNKEYYSHSAGGFRSFTKVSEFTTGTLSRGGDYRRVASDTAPTVTCPTNRGDFVSGCEPISGQCTGNTDGTQDVTCTTYLQPLPGQLLALPTRLLYLSPWSFSRPRRRGIPYHGSNVLLVSIPSMVLHV